MYNRHAYSNIERCNLRKEKNIVFSFRYSKELLINNTNFILTDDFSSIYIYLCRKFTKSLRQTNKQKEASQLKKSFGEGFQIYLK